MPRARNVANTSSNVGLINCNVADLHTKARTLYVSSGSDLKQANRMIDGQAATTYSFSAEDRSPVAIIDLGKATTISRISAIYAAKEGMIDFYVLQNLPGVSAKSAPKALPLGQAALANLRPV